MGGREQKCAARACLPHQEVRSVASIPCGFHAERDWRSGGVWGRGRSPGACTTPAADKHHVLMATVFTLLPDLLLEHFDCTNNKWASKNVVLKAFETQG